MAFNPYKILGVDSCALPDDIRAAYRRQAGIHHPDKNIGDPYAKERFQQAKKAYEILLDPERREAFDSGGTIDRFDPAPGAVNALISALYDAMAIDAENNIINNMRAIVAEQINAIRVSREQVNTKLGKLHLSKKRFSYAGAERNILSDAIDHQINMGKMQLNSMEEEDKQWSLAQQMLQSYYDIEDFQMQRSDFNIGYVTFDSTPTKTWE